MHLIHFNGREDKPINSFTNSWQHSTSLAKGSQPSWNGPSQSLCITTSSEPDNGFRHPIYEKANEDSHIDSLWYRISTKQWCGNLPRERSREVTFPWSRISREVVSERVSQKRILLSKWPLIIVVPAPSVVTRSLQLDPANFVSIPENRQKVVR